MTTDQFFPQNLLNGSIEQRVEYFEKQVVLGHPTLLSVHKEVENLIFGPKRPQLIFLIGPSGVGKSTFKEKLYKEVLQKRLQKMEEDPGYLPIGHMQLEASERETFKWPNYYIKASRVLNEPESFLARKINPKIRSIGGEKSLATQRLGFENAMKYRKTEFFILDEAHHLIRGTSGKKLEATIEVIKSQALDTNATFVLIGTYELRYFLYLNEELSRRSVDIHFKRYSTDKDDLKVFKGMIASFQHRLPFEKEPDLLQYWDFLYERTIGCVGVLKDWLSKAYTKALQNNEDTISIEILQNTALSEAAVLQMLQSSLEGERDMDRTKQGTELRNLLRLDKYSNQQPVSPAASARKRSFKRAPKRDKVGIPSKVQA